MTQRRSRFGMLLLLGALAIPGPATALDQKMVNWCIGKNSPTNDQMIQGCTAAIASRKFKTEILGTLYLNRAIAYMNMGQYSRAEPELEQAVRLAPLDPLVHLGLSRLYGNTGQPDKAIEAASVAVTLNPKTTLGYYNRANIFFQRGENERAIEDFTG